MQRFVKTHEIDAQTVDRNHGGQGVIQFRRLLTGKDFAGPIEFVDFTVIPPGSTIGIHRHDGNEEIYLIAAGRPRVAVDGEETRLKRGSIAVVHSGQTHQLLNDTSDDVEIFVVQVALEKNSLTT